MNDISRDARRRLRSEASDYGAQFDSSLIHNYVADRYAEDVDLREVVDIAERAYDVAAGSELDLDVFGAAEGLNDKANALAEARVEELVASLDDEMLADWSDAWTDEQIEAARRERDEFLGDVEVPADD